MLDIYPCILFIYFSLKINFMEVPVGQNSVNNNIE